jgi:lipopolysaccharide export system protein LptA
MRKTLLILATLLILLGAFAVYFLTQTKFRFSTEGRSADQFADSSFNSSGLIRPGSGAWSKQFDKQGNLYYQFKCSYYDPQPDGTVKVRSPVIQFFLSGGQVMQIEGKDGIIRFAQGTENGMLSNSPTEPPRYGSLRDVVVKLFDSQTALTPANLQMTMTMTNAQFDNDTFRLFTQEYTDDAGKVWHEDQIPVTVTAKDYAFTGSGLVLYWNDIDKRLKSLQIAHGTDLTLYDAANLSSQSASPSSPTAPQPIQPAAPVAPQDTTASPSEPRQRYTATFYDSVRVTQGGQQLVQADQMDVDFAAKAENATTESQAPAPETPPSPTNSASPSTAPPSTQPAAQPIHVHWQGPMKMVPTDLANAEPLPDGKAIIHLLGSPVHVHQIAADTGQTIDLRCESLRYRTDDSAAHLTGNVHITQTKADGAVSTIDGQDLDYSRLTHQARFNGPGQTRFPDPNDPKSVLTADWDKRCTVRFYDLPNNQTEIEHADLEGDVLVQHPRFELCGQKDVRLQFDKPQIAQDGKTAAPPLREIIADGGAKCVVHEANNLDRQISGQTLKLTRDPGPDGKLYAREIDCNGSVHAEQDNEQLTAEGLQITLLPTTRQTQTTDQLADQVALDRLVAWNNVQVEAKDGSEASADNLQVQSVDGQPHVKLVGSNDQPAVVKNKTSTITGQTILFSPHDQTAEIDGAGTYDGLQQAQSPGQTQRPMKLIWQQKAFLDGNQNQAVVIGGVTATSDDGLTTQSATCDRIIATLMDVAPATRPATRPANAATVADSADFMRNKQVKFLSMQMDPASDAASQQMAQLESSTQDSSGRLLHRYDLLSRKIDFDPQARQLNVNGPGDILAVEKSPSGVSTTQPAASAIGGTGNTAIDWKKRFTYDDVARTATIEGDITIVHEGIGPNPQTVRIEHADTVRADFYSEPQPNSKDKTAQASPPKLKALTADGQMTIRTADKTILCGELDFDPVENILTCRHGQLRQVTVIDNNDLNGVACGEASLNIKTNELKKMTNVTGHGR